MYDIVYAVLRQRPQIQSDVVQFFKKHNDEISATYWKNFQIDSHINQFDLAVQNSPKNRLPMVYKKTPINLHEVREEYLSIPNNIGIFFVKFSHVF